MIIYSFLFEGEVFIMRFSLCHVCNLCMTNVCIYVNPNTDQMMPPLDPHARGNATMLFRPIL